MGMIKHIKKIPSFHLLQQHVSLFLTVIKLSLIIFVFIPPINAQTKLTPILADYGNFYSTLPRTGGHIIVDSLINQLVRLKVNTYMFGISENNDWYDLISFLPKSEMAGISVWIYLMPPSESAPLCSDCGNQKPFRLNYIQWAKVIAKLSIRYSNIKAYAIDDFWGNIPNNYTIAYIETMIAAGKTINPNLKFYPLTYFGEVNKPYTMGDLASKIDGLIVSYPKDSLAIEYAIMEAMPHNRVSISLPASTGTNDGDYGRVYKTATITNPDSVTLTFHYSDDMDLNAGYSGYHYIQVAIDSTLGDNQIPSTSSDFTTDGTAWWSVEQSTATYNSGTHAITVTYTSGTYDFGLWKFGTIMANIKYRLKFRAKSLTSTRKMLLNNGATTTAISNPNLSSAYQNYEFIVSRTSLGSLYITFSPDAGANFTIDDITFQPIGTNGVWSTNATGIDDSTVTVNLKSCVTGRNSFKINLGIYENCGVGNLPISGFFSNISSYGIILDPDLTTWTDTVSGPFTVTQIGVTGNALPLIIMTSTSTKEYNIRHSDGATPEHIANYVNMVSHFILTGQVEGVVTYCLDLNSTGTAIFNAVKNVFWAIHNQMLLH